MSGARVTARRAVAAAIALAVVIAAGVALVASRGDAGPREAREDAAMPAHERRAPAERSFEPNAAALADAPEPADAIARPTAPAEETAPLVAAAAPELQPAGGAEEAAIHARSEERPQPPPTVAGIVVDFEERPIEGVRVQVRDRGAPPRKLGTMDCATDAEGRFELRSDLTLDRIVEVSIRRNGYEALPGEGRVETASGDAGMRFRLYPVATLRVQVLLDDESLRDEISVESACDSNPLWEPLMTAGMWEWLDEASERDQAFDHEEIERPATEDLDTSRYEQGPVPPGLYDVRVVAAPSGALLAEAHGVRVHPDSAERDDVLVIDLRGRLATHTLVVADETGASLRGAKVRYRPSRDSVEPWAELLDRSHGTFRLVALDEPLDVQVDAHQRASAVLLGLEEDASVHLGPGHPIELALAWGAPPLPGDNVDVVLTADALPAPTEARAWVDPDGRASAWLASPGRHAIRLVVRERGSPREIACAVLPDAVVIDDRPGEVTELFVRGSRSSSRRAR